MNRLVRIKPKFTRVKTNFNKEKINIDSNELNSKLKKILHEIDLIINSTNHEEIPFEIIHKEKIPPKSKRIQPEIVKYLKWKNKGSIYDPDDQRIILLFVSSKKNLQNNKNLIEKILFLNKNNTEINKETLNSKFNIKITKTNIDELLTFLIQDYDFIKPYQELNIDDNEAYFCDILCNEFLFENEKIKNSNKVLIQKNKMNENHKKYLYNPAKNLKLFLNLDTADDFIQKNNIIEKANNQITIGILDGKGYPNENCIVKSYIDENRYVNDEPHGSMVASIAITGDRLNGFNDGCGIFKTTLCIVARSGIEVNELINNIKKAINDNQHIKIWNISFGYNEQINPTRGTSYLAQELDKIAFEQDIIFIISGGNRETGSQLYYLSPPADSLSSITVNALDGFNEPASYSKWGMNFLNFSSPTCSIFGGDENQKIIVQIDDKTTKYTMGTSFAAPLVARFIAKIQESFPSFNKSEVLAIFYHGLYLKSINNNFTFDSLTGICKLDKNTHINDFIKSKENSVRMIFSGTSDLKKSECINFDLPLDEKKFNNKIIITTVSNSIIDHSHGVEAIRTSVDAKIVFNDKNQNHKTKENEIFLDDDNYLREKDLIKHNKKWHLVSNKEFAKNIKKAFWKTDDEFISAKIILENNNRDVYSFDKLKETKINYAIVIEIENKKNIDNFDKIMQRLEINNFEPVILIENENDNIIELD